MDDTDGRGGTVFASIPMTYAGRREADLNDFGHAGTVTPVARLTEDTANARDAGTPKSGVLLMLSVRDDRVGIMPLCSGVMADSAAPDRPALAPCGLLDPAVAEGNCRCRPTGSLVLDNPITRLPIIIESDSHEVEHHTPTLRTGQNIIN